MQNGEAKTYVLWRCEVKTYVREKCFAEIKSRMREFQGRKVAPMLNQVKSLITTFSSGWKFEAKFTTGG